MRPSVLIRIVLPAEQGPPGEYSSFPKKRTVLDETDSVHALIGRPYTRAKENLGLHMGLLSWSLLVVPRRGVLSTSLSSAGLNLRYHSFSVDSTRVEESEQADALVSSQASCGPRNSISFRKCGPMPVVYLGVPTVDYSGMESQTRMHRNRPQNSGLSVWTFQLPPFLEDPSKFDGRTQVKFAMIRRNNISRRAKFGMPTFRFQITS
ncbi:hypothetical protein BDW62DRAFT_148887 [Aspergillus aurantiobrunneus]